MINPYEIPCPNPKKGPFKSSLQNIVANSNPILLFHFVCCPLANLFKLLRVIRCIILSGIFFLLYITLTSWCWWLLNKSQIKVVNHSSLSILSFWDVIPKLIPRDFSARLSVETLPPWAPWASAARSIPSFRGTDGTLGGNLVLYSPLSGSEKTWKTRGLTMGVT